MLFLREDRNQLKAQYLSKGFSHGNVDELDKVPDEAHDGEAYRNRSAQLDILCKRLSQLPILTNGVVLHDAEGGAHS